MRIAAGDPNAMDVKEVLVDGIVVDTVTLADEEAGYVEYFLADDHGKLTLDHHGELMTRRMYGRVEIIMRDNAGTLLRERGHVEVIMDAPADA